ncbi:hypothetical protein [Nitrosomonas sp. Nm33]|uniref:hypothetical protein n=1 Tax=Nitrosomonas sp. Nm33 TaxID=133724 RepID=UPI0008958668|nr:hypothetical protein [Nitrosomonas sp. Nm33]SDY20948.1 hypothetical protein SAMN05421755_101149 [Nitrosomonas sp. Nm33]
MDCIIATLPRSGSHFLCELLARNRLGVPAEDFNIYLEVSPFSTALALGITTEEYLKRPVRWMQKVNIGYSKRYHS